MPAEKYFKGDIEVVYLDDELVHEKVTDKAGRNKIYRHSDAEALERELEENQIVILEAAMGAGKSSVLRSLTSRFQSDEVIFYNGHNFGNNIEADALLDKKLSEKNEKTKMLIIDSADYLFLRKKFIRTGGKNYQQNCTIWIDKIKEFARNNPDIKIVMTSHDENWRKTRMDESLYEEFSKNFSKAKVFTPSNEVPESTIVRFLEHEEDLSREEAWFVAKLWENPKALDAMNEMGYLKKPHEEISGTTLLRTPRVIAHIFKKFPKLKSQLKAIFKEDVKETDEWIKEFIRCAISTDYQSIFLPIITEKRGSTKEEVWGTIDAIEPE